MSKKHTQIFVALALGVVIALLSSLLAMLPTSPTERLRLGLTDYLYVWQVEKGLVKPSQDIVIIGIDDKTLKYFGRWQDWRRTTFAELVNKLTRYKPAVIAIDVSFSEPSRNKDDDDALAEAIRAAGNIVLVVQDRPGSEQLDITPIDKLLAAANEQTGVVNFTVDSDNVVRRGNIYYPQIKVSENEIIQMYSFAATIADNFLQKNLKGDLDNYLAQEKNNPIDNNNYIINFFGKPNSYQSVSMADFASDQFDRLNIDLKNKIILIGATAIDLRDNDFVPTSFGDRMPGVEIHANAIQTLIEKRFLVEQDRLIVLLLILIFSLLGTLIPNYLRVIGALSSMVMILILYFFVANFFFARGIILDIFHPSLAFFLAFVAAYLYRFIFADREKRQLKGAFTHYLAGPLVEKITQNPESLKLGGEKKELTIFFSDIAGFTTISEQLSPEELVHLLNDYLGEMTDIILESGGTLDKYIGDAVMAFWGAPVDEPEHAQKACYAALDQLAALERLKTEHRIPKNLDLAIRIGINTGEVVVGNMGSSKRFSYTVMGDAVNLASRLEGVNKSYNTDLIISEDTYQQVKDSVEVRELDIIRVKGKQKGVRIYELAAKKGELGAEKRHIFQLFAGALAAYRAGKWSEAKKGFTEVQKNLPNDGPSTTFLARIAEYEKNPPPKDWGGIYTMTTK